MCSARVVGNMSLSSYVTVTGLVVLVQQLGEPVGLLFLYEPSDGGAIQNDDVLIPTETWIQLCSYSVLFLLHDVLAFSGRLRGVTRLMMPSGDGLPGHSLSRAVPR